MEKKIRIGVLFGGRSPEHEVSLLSAKHIAMHLDPDRYSVIPIGIDKDGKWHLLASPDFFFQLDASQLRSFNPDEVKARPFFPLQDLNKWIDVLFPVLHGPNGEDGTMQGLARILALPFVGADVLGSAVSMDKDVMKRLLREKNIPVSDFLCFHEGEEIDFKKVASRLGLPFFVKPANLGSSIGITKVSDAGMFERSIANAFACDRKILLEKTVVGREIECGVLGENPRVATLPGLVTPHEELLSYEAKYVDASFASYELPAKLKESLVEMIQELSIATFDALCCEGMARVDLFLTDAGELLVNELNSIPGCTPISPFPKLWEASGVPFSQFLDRLIDVTLTRENLRRLPLYRAALP